MVKYTNNELKDQIEICKETNDHMDVNNSVDIPAQSPFENASADIDVPTTSPFSNIGSDEIDVPTSSPFDTY